MPLPKLFRKHRKIGDDRSDFGDDIYFEHKIMLSPRAIRNHFIVIVSYITLEVLTGRLIRPGRFSEYFCLYVADLAFFYYSLFLLIPYLSNFRKTGWKSISLLVVSLMGYFSIRTLIYAGLYVNFNWVATLKTNVFYATSGWRTIWIFGLSAFYWDHLSIIQKVKNENIYLNAILHARVNPHLLFNSLNFAYADVGPHSKGGRMLVLLGEFTRYSMARLPADGKTLLSDEIKQLDCLIRINKLRFADLVLNEDIDHYLVSCRTRIPPKIIISLAENLFKYGDLYNTDQPAKIAVWKDEKLLHVQMENCKMVQEDIVSHKIGLHNVRQRLKNIYGHNYRLDIDNRPDFFKIDLSLPL